MRTRRSGGFTLIELLVALSVIALLIAILIPALHAAKKSGVRASCIANLRGLGETIAVYRGAHDGIFPDVAPLPDLPTGKDELVGALAGHCDAPLPSVQSDGTVLATAPWRCPADPSVARRFGMSYEYEMGFLVLAYQVDGYPAPVVRVSRLADDQPSMLVLSDARPIVRSQTDDPDAWHRGPGESDRNALRADGSADWLP